jgi:hypothetical protein
VLFQPWFRGKTWNPWRVVLKAIFALEMTAEEKAFFRSIADREPPTEPCKEFGSSPAVVQARTRSPQF